MLCHWRAAARLVKMKRAGDRTLKVSLVDPSLFTAPYDQALMDGLRGIGDRVRLYACAMADGSPLCQDRDVVEHFYRSLARAPFSRMPPAISRWCKGLDHAASMRRLGGAVRAWQPDVIHFQWLPCEG